MKKEKKKFKLFDFNKDGKGVEEIEDRKPTLKFFFKLLKRKFSQILQLNLLMLFQVIPLIVIFCVVYVYGAKTPLVTDAMYIPLYGISKVSPGFSGVPSLDMAGIQLESTVYFTPAMIIVTICMLLFLAITYGWQNVGAAYVLRGLFRGDPIFVFSDYFYGIKRNFKQGFFMGLLDFLCTVVLIVDLFFFSSQIGGFNAIMYGVIIAVFLLFLTMRFYIYQLLITFDLKNFKILKNSLIFTALGIKRNIMAYLGIILIIVLQVFLIILALSYGISVFLILPFVYIMALVGFITTYAAYPVIDKYMIAPYAVKEEIAEDAQSDGVAEDEPASDESIDKE